MQGVMAAANDTVLPLIAKLSPRVVRVLGLNPGPMTLQGSNTYLVGSGAQRLLIDSGEGIPEFEHALEEALATAGAELGKRVVITQVLLTHWHRDHVGGVSMLQRVFPNVVLWKRRSAYGSPSVEDVCSPPPPVLQVEGATLRTIHTPGHTDDHVCVFLEEEQALFTGDTILGTGSSVFSCYTDYISSLQLLQEFEPQLLYPAHGPVVTSAARYIEEYILHRHQRESQILQALESASSAETQQDMCIQDLVRQVYVSTPSTLWGAAGVNVFHHVKNLVSKGEAVIAQCSPALESAISNIDDYALFGEGMKGDSQFMQRIFTEMKVAKVQRP